MNREVSIAQIHCHIHLQALELSAGWLMEAVVGPDALSSPVLYPSQ